MTKQKDENAFKGRLREQFSKQFLSWGERQLGGQGKELEAYEKKYTALKLYALGISGRDIYEQTGISDKLVNYYANRCLMIAPDGTFWGLRALISNKRLKEYNRTKPVESKLPEQQGGMAGVLFQLFEAYPTLEPMLYSRINKSRHSNPHEHKLSPKALFAIFMAALESLGVPKDGWPYNTKHRGRRSITLYMQAVLQQNFTKSVANREESAAKAHLAVGRGERTVVHSIEPYDTMEIDAHHIDCFCTVGFQTPEGVEADVALSRLWILFLLECASDSIVSHTVVYRSEVGASDIIDLFRKALSMHVRPLPVVENLRYAPGSGHPSEVIPACCGAVWNVVKCDGALAHLSDQVTSLARKSLGFALNIGPPGHFERRPTVERTFQMIATSLFGRLPSTTGHAPGIGRGDDPEETARVLSIRDTHIRHLLDVTVANHNATPSEGLGFLSPLKFIEKKMAVNGGNLLFRYLPGGVLGRAAGALNSRCELTVRGSRKDGRLPYVQFHRVHYTNAVLQSTPELLSTKITIEFDHADIRTIFAFTMDGISLGELRACGRWAKTKHSLKTRKAINSLMHLQTLHISATQDPVQSYLNFLVGSNKKTARAKKNRGVSPKNATEAKRVSDESGLDLRLPGEVDQFKEFAIASLDSANVIRGAGTPPDISNMLKHRGKK